MCSSLKILCSDWWLSDMTLFCNSQLISKNSSAVDVTQFCMKSWLKTVSFTAFRPPLRWPSSGNRRTSGTWRTVNVFSSCCQMSSTFICDRYSADHSKFCLEFVESVMFLVSVQSRLIPKEFCLVIVDSVISLIPVVVGLSLKFSSSHCRLSKIFVLCCSRLRTKSLCLAIDKSVI